MKIFQFEEPVLNAIKANIIALLNKDGEPKVDERLLFLDYEPTEFEIFSYLKVTSQGKNANDGAICVYSPLITEMGAGTQTGEQETESTIQIDCYAFGDVFEESGVEQKTVGNATKRGQTLTTVAYKTVTNAEELENAFGTGINISEKRFVTIEKSSPFGTEDATRTAIVYRSKFTFRLEEDIPTESLGLEYDTTSATQETENP